MDFPTMPLNSEDALQDLWERMWALETAFQEQHRLNYRTKTELDSALGVIGLLLVLRMRMVELEEKVKRLEESQPFT